MSTSDVQDKTWEEEKDSGGARHEVSASTVVRLMGIASEGDLKLLESKLDGLVGKLSAIGLKVDRLEQSNKQLIGREDIERLEVGISDLRTLIKKVLVELLAKGEK